VTYQWNLPYSSSEIIRRLELLDEDDVVGCGGFGTMYKMVMDDGTVRDVISPDGSPDRFPDLRRALIGGTCRFVAVGPSSRSAI
jgi:hypothetical protein